MWIENKPLESLYGRRQYIIQVISLYEWMFYDAPIDFLFSIP